MKIFHISDKIDIEIFHPRRSKQMYGHKDYVWAISEEMLHNYLFPRGCPRICIANEVAHLLTEWLPHGQIPVRKAFVFIPESWEPRLDSCILYQYELNRKNFTLLDSIAGYYVSESSEVPIDVTTIEQCKKHLTNRHVEVIVTPPSELKKIKDHLIPHTDQFSIIKWDNL